MEILDNEFLQTIPATEILQDGTDDATGGNFVFVLAAILYPDFFVTQVPNHEFLLPMVTHLLKSRIKRLLAGVDIFGRDH